MSLYLPSFILENILTILTHNTVRLLCEIDVDSKMIYLKKSLLL